MELKIEYLPVDLLKPYERNARLHQPEDIDAICESIKEFGFDDPIGIWSDRNVIVEGHGRLMAAKKLGMESVPCIRLDHLTDEQRRAYALAHNRTAELSEWDLAMKQLEIMNITDIDMSKLGFSQTDIRKFNGCDPFSLSGWVGCVIGIIGRKYRFRDDPFKVDIDMCLQNMLVDRIIWMDTRYTFPQFRDNNVGGNSAFRTREGFEHSVESLKKKWKGAITVRDLKNQVRIKINAPRKQAVKI